MSHRISNIGQFTNNETVTAGGTAVSGKISLTDNLNSILSHLPLLSMLNVKYIISAYELPSNPTLNLVNTVSSTRFKIPIYLYENKDVLPRVYYANNVNFLGNNESDSFNTITKPDTDFKDVSFIECDSCINNPNLLNKPSKTDSLSITNYQDGLLNLNVSTQSGRWLIFSESNLPGWQATIDNQPTLIYTSNYLFQAIYIPKGEHQIRFIYGGLL